MKFLRSKVPTITSLVFTLVIAATGCAQKNERGLNAENAEMKAELRVLKAEIELLRKQVNVAVSASTNSLQIARSHSELIKNINGQLVILSDAMDAALNTAINREKTDLLR